MFASRNTSIDLDGTKNSPARPRQPVPAAEPGLERHVDAHAPDSSRPAENPVLPAPVSEMHSARTRAREILFVDPRVSDITTLLSRLRPEVEAILLDPARPAARQMATALAEERELAAIHIIAHGAPGRVDFTAGGWSAATLAEDADDLAAIGRALAASGDLRLWSCHTAAGPAGPVFVAELAQASGASVAAATRLVGAAAQGGRWELSSTAEAPLTVVGMVSYWGVLTAFTYTGNNGGNWANANNWNSNLSGRYPGQSNNTGDTATINSGSTVTYNTTDTIASLTNGGTLNFNAGTSLTLGGTGTVLSNTGTIALGSSGTLTTGGGSGSFSNSGSITLSGTSVLNAASGGITNSGSGANITGSGTLTGAVTNQSSATIAVTGTSATLTANSGISNSATITIATGDTLSSNSGALTNSSGGSITISGTGVLSNTATTGTGINNSGGSINVGSGQVSSSSSSAAAIENQGGGTISLAAGILSAASGGITNIGSGSQISGNGTLTGALTNSTSAT